MGQWVGGKWSMGRWVDGLLSVDFIKPNNESIGLPNVKLYFNKNSTEYNNTLAV